MKKPAEVGLAATSRGNALDQWQAFSETVARVTARYGYTAPKQFDEGGAGNRMCTFQDGHGRRLRVEAIRGTTLDLTTPAVAQDDPSIEPGIVWRDGHDVREPKPP